MIKAFKQSNKFKCALIISVIFHTVIITMLIYSTFKKKIDVRDRNGNNINAIMTDTSAITGQYNLQQNHEIDSRYYSEQQHQKKVQKMEEQISERKRLQEIEKKRKLVKKQEKIVANTNKKEQKARTASEVKEKAVAHQEEKAKSILKSKVKTTVNAVSSRSVVNDLLNDLLLSKSSLETGTLNRSIRTTDTQRKSTAYVINDYLNQVKRAIQNKFYDADMFKGRTCVIRIQLTADGLLTSSTRIDGDTALCQAAIKAARMARIPKPPDQNVWHTVKDTLLEFKP